MIDYNSIYNFILPLHILFCFLLGICFYLIKHEGKPQLKGYYIGRYLIAAGYLLLGTVCAIQYFFLKNESITTTQVTFLVSNAFDTSLFALGLTKMVDVTFITRRRILFEAIFIAVVSLPLILLYAFSETTTLSLKIFFLCIVALILAKQILNYIQFRKRYIRAKAQLDNFYSSDMGIHLDWVNRSFALFSALMVVALAVCIIPYFWVVITIIFIIWGSFLYIFISTINYAPKIMIIEQVLEENEKNTRLVSATSGLLPDDKRKKEETFPAATGNIPVFAALDKWVQEELYLNPGITIEEVAAYIGTNRNKISLHLNTYLNVSFREWITSLRIEKAKTLLITEPDLSITETGAKVSIPNRSNFDKMFKKLVGESPAAFRIKHAKNTL